MGFSKKKCPSLPVWDVHCFKYYNTKRSSLVDFPSISRNKQIWGWGFHCFYKITPMQSTCQFETQTKQSFNYSGYFFFLTLKRKFAASLFMLNQSGILQLKFYCGNKTKKKKYFVIINIKKYCSFTCFKNKLH